MLAEMGIEVTIPSKSNRKEPIPHDSYSYKRRHLIENLFVDITHYRGISAKYHQLARHVLCRSPFGDTAPADPGMEGVKVPNIGTAGSPAG